MADGMMSRKMNAVFIILLLAALPGCGRPYHIKGRVIVAGGMEPAGSITEITGRPVPDEGESVSGAVVTVYYALKDDGSPDEKSTWKKTVRADAKGMFDINDYSVPSEKLRVGLRVSRDGCETVYAAYWDYKDIEPQVFLVKMKKAAAPAKRE